MKDLYAVVGISKQAVQQYHMRQLKASKVTCKFFEQADLIRREHPRSGCRKMAMDMVCKGWGRDKIENLLLGNGYRVCYPVNFCRTTKSQHQLYFPNLIEGLELNKINQVVQTDITYYRIGEKFYYLVFIIDVYSRRIVGYAVNKTLEAEGNIKALKRMFTIRQNDSLENMIHHSDKGSQYIDQIYLKLLKARDIRISMCNEAWENAYSERINKTIKEEYLDGWDITDFATLCRLTRKAVHHYNFKRRHQSLTWQTPIEFERNVENLDPANRPKFKLYKQLETY